MSERIIRMPNSPGSLEDGYRVLQGKQEYVTYPEDSSFRIWYSDRPWRYEAHEHSAVEIVLTLEGAVDYETEGKTWHVAENDIIVIPPGMPHSLNMGEHSRRHLFLFEPDAIYGMRDVKSVAAGFNKVFLLNDGSAAHTEIRQLLMKTVEAYNEQDFMWNTVCYSYMMQMYAILGQLYLTGARGVRRPSQTNPESEIITGAMTYIDNHYREDLTLDDIAAFAGFSRFYFSRCFKKQTGSSFKDYLCQKRLQVAMDLLIRTNKSMRDIAVESGFGSVATFNRTFREKKNCTPTQYRAIYGTY